MRHFRVVGAGIVGASIACHLARLGAAVTVVERATQPAAGATGASFAWFGSGGGLWPGGAIDLRASVLPDWQRLAGEVPGVDVRWTGSIWLGDEEPGPHQEQLDRAAVAGREPHLLDPPERALLTPTDGVVDPVAATRALLRAAQEHGARVVTGVHGEPAPDRASRSREVVVLAAGAEVPSLCGVPVATSPSDLIELAGPAGLTRGVLAGARFAVREVSPGRYLATGTGAEQAFDAPLREIGRRTGRRPMPPGGPVIGPLGPSAYVAVMDSAITLAPVAGRLIAHELVTGEPCAELARCRIT